mgnify:CR=1 FL=1
MKTIDKIGIVLLILGFVISFLGYGTIIIGLPVYIVGIITLLFGALKIKIKLLWILTPMILFYPTFKLIGSISYYFSDIQKVDLILPGDFKGKAIIIDNTDFGQKFEKKSRREQIIFDKSGIVFYPTEFEMERSKFRVFVKQKNGELKQILLSSDSSKKTTLLSYGESSFKTTIETENKYIPYDFIQIGESFSEHNYSDKRSELIELIQDGKLKTVYNKTYK